jgi:hypothetical protein
MGSAMRKVHRFKWVWIGLVLCAGYSPAALGQGAAKGDEGQILALENAWNQAELQHDPGALELILPVK